MDVNAIKTIARQELVINIRNRWTLVFAGIFGVLVLAISISASLPVAASALCFGARTSAAY